MQIRKVFDDAYKSNLSCIVVDNIERLLDYGSIGPRYSNLVLQALLVLLKKEPPPGRKLLVLCTTSRREVLEQMELISCFTSVLHVPNLTESVHMMNMLNYLAEGGGPGYFTREERAQIANKIQGRKVWVGVKKLMAYIDMARQMEPKNRAWKFLAKLEEEGALAMA
jgi:vesicle-fusing ATPase